MRTILDLLDRHLFTREAHYCKWTHSKACWCDLKNARELTPDWDTHGSLPQYDYKWDKLPETPQELP